MPELKNVLKSGWHTFADKYLYIHANSNMMHSIVLIKVQYSRKLKLT